MKEVLYTIPLMDAFRADDECPFCFIERNIEQHAIDFVLGSEASYMEEDIREQTDKIGFCKDHLKKMFTYGNNLGNALIMETHMRRKLTELRNEMKHYSGAKVSFLDKLGEVIARYGEHHIEVMGFTDSVPVRAGSKYADNMELSQARAYSVYKFLVKEKGMSEERLECAGRGEQEPIASNSTEEGRAMNRRVEIRIYSKLDTE